MQVNGLADQHNNIVKLKYVHFFNSIIYVRPSRSTVTYLSISIANGTKWIFQSFLISNIVEVYLWMIQSIYVHNFVFSLSIFHLDGQKKKVKRIVTKLFCVVNAGYSTKFQVECDCLVYNQLQRCSLMRLIVNLQTQCHT